MNYARTTPWLLAPGPWLLLALALLAPLRSAQAAEKPNIVLLFADDLGINELSCYGRQDQPTPNLDHLATEGLRFTCGYCSQPICSPSRAGILTGKTPGRLHITTYLPGRRDARSQMVLHPKIQMQLPLAETTLAEYLKTAGYATACIGKWHLGRGGFGPAEQGFDFVYSRGANSTPSATEGGKGEYAHTAQALKFIDQSKDRPFFLYVPYNTPHLPLAAKPELIEKHKAAFSPTYAAMIETLDDCVGLVLKKLKDLNLEENTLVIFTSDNGGLSIANSADGPPTHNSPYRGGKGFVYEGGLREPLIIRWPGQIKPAVVDAPISHLDFVPTLLTLAGIPVPAGLDGQNIAPFLLGEGGLPERKFFWHSPHYNNQGGRPSGAVRDGDWKLVTYYDTLEQQLFNLKNDISETNNLATQEVARTTRLKKLHDDWLVAINAQRNTPNPDFDPALFKKLYVDFDPSRPVLKPTAAEMIPESVAWRALMKKSVADARAAQQAKRSQK